MIDINSVMGSKPTLVVPHSSPEARAANAPVLPPIGNVSAKDIREDAPKEFNPRFKVEEGTLVIGKDVNKKGHAIATGSDEFHLEAIMGKKGSN